MKKVLNLLVVAVAALTVFTSCNPSQTASGELVSVSIIGSGNSARSLVAENDFDIANVNSWTYTAKKADNGIKTGETTDAVSLTKDSSGNWMTQPLSQGSWNFKLFGYNADGKLICSGSVDNQTITVDKHSVKITVKPSQTETGKIVVDSAIKIVDKNGGAVYDADAYTMTYTVTNSSSEDVTADVNAGTAVKSGQYKVTVVFKAAANDGEEYTAASASKYINVYDNLITTVSGTISEIEQAAELIADDFVEELNNAASGSTVKLNSNSAIYEDVVITKSLTIDLNGNTLTISPYVDFTIGDSSLTEDITVTIKNGKIDGDGYLINDSWKASLKFEDVTFSANRKSVWSGNTIADESGLATTCFDDAKSSTRNYKSLTDEEITNAGTYITWFESKFADTGKITWETKKQSESSTKDDELVVTIYNADVFASYNLISKYFVAQRIKNTITKLSVEVEADLDLNKLNWTPIDASTEGTDPLKTFDFNGHTISGLNIQSSVDEKIGLFGIAKNIEIKNLIIEDASVNAENAQIVAILLGRSLSCKEISNVTVKNSTLTGKKYVGVIVAHGYADISGCKVENVTVNADEQAGGIAGYIITGSITNCNVTNSTIIAATESVGGIAGKPYANNAVNDDLTITNNTVSNSTVKVGETVPTTNIGYTSNGYCGYICGGKYINGNDKTPSTSGLEIVSGYDSGKGITTVKDNIWSTT